MACRSQLSIESALESSVRRWRIGWEVHLAWYPAVVVMGLVWMQREAVAGNRREVQGQYTTTIVDGKRIICRTEGPLVSSDSLFLGTVFFTGKAIM